MKRESHFQLSEDAHTQILNVRDLVNTMAELASAAVPKQVIALPPEALSTALFMVARLMEPPMTYVLGDPPSSQQQSVDGGQRNAAQTDAKKKQCGKGRKAIARMEAMIDEAICDGVFLPHMRSHLEGYASLCGEAGLAEYIGDAATAKAALSGGPGGATYQAIGKAIREGVFPQHLRDHLVAHAASVGEQEFFDYIAEFAHAKAEYEAAGASA